MEAIVGESEPLKEALAIAEKVAGSNCSVLITGESGTGKELMAQFIHSKSRRAERPMMPVNCASLVENLIESELFGHERGAFTGAITRRIGKFEVANTGTLFLDEIGEMSSGMQAKLLRVLETGEFCRVGGNEIQKSTARVITATNRNLAGQIELGNFRKDLYYRINVVRIDMPALRYITDDIPILVAHFLEVSKNRSGDGKPIISKEVMKRLVDHTWPGNTRELKNVMDRVTVLNAGEKVLISDLKVRDACESIYDVGSGMRWIEATNAFRKNYLLKTLEDTRGDVSKASRILGLQRTYMYKLMREFNIPTEGRNLRAGWSPGKRNGGKEKVK
jgi:DNA-binding NtrC family response regulator